MESREGRGEKKQLENIQISIEEGRVLEDEYDQNM